MVDRYCIDDEVLVVDMLYGSLELSRCKAARLFVPKKPWCVLVRVGVKVKRLR